MQAAPSEPPRGAARRGLNTSKGDPDANHQLKNLSRTGTCVERDHGASISIILDHSEPGHGPRLHRHPYDETWVVDQGTLSFQLGDELLDVGSGDIVIAPPNVPHKFTNRGPGRSKHGLHPCQPEDDHRMAGVSSMAVRPKAQPSPWREALRAPGSSS